MRYLGNKDSIASDIYGLLADKGLTNKDLTFFDAFCGTGAIADVMKKSFNIIANDSLTWSVIYTEGRLVAEDCTFENLGFDPFEFFNKNNETLEGFMFNNYSPGGSARMYFSSINASRIDYFRAQIEEWKVQKLINTDEYCYLLACLLESVSFVSNTAGVYGAFLKHWDSRALKPIQFIKVVSQGGSHKELKFFNRKTEEIIDEVECDILYLDPPYTQNQYGTQYHLLETLILDDNPTISPITGSRSTKPMRSDWSKDYKVHILFNQVIENTKASYVLFSYNSDGFMSKDFIEATLKRYGEPETYTCKKISYKKYRNFKTKRENEHFEYLFFIKKKSLEKVNYESPLNYIGSKSKMIDEIKNNLPEKIDTFIDAFGGGFNVGINVNANTVIYNDMNFLVKDLVESFRINDVYNYLLYIKKMIKKFNLEKANAESYNIARDYYNSLSVSKRDPRLLYTIILYGFQQQIRFNSSYEFNNPVGMRWFNDKVLEKLISFSAALEKREYIFKSCDYLELEQEINEDTFVYMDPPYRLTTGSYNDGKRGFKGWDLKAESEMFEFADSLSNRGIKFMISYVLEHKGVNNEEICSWVEEKGYRLVEVPDIPGRKRKEVLIVNYDKSADSPLCNQQPISEESRVVF